MRRRFHLSWHSSFEGAVIAKKEIKEANPDKEYQIRRKKSNFELVERLASNEAEVVREIRNAIPRRKKSRRISPIL